jgi:catechol 2,3-dioxygenase-like lactoylglutathione lyase family enzyme
MIEGISAVTLGTHEMPRAVRFYRALGFEVLHGGEESRHSPVFEQGRAISTSSPSLPSGAGPGGGA